MLERGNENKRFTSIQAVFEKLIYFYFIRQPRTFLDLDHTFKNNI